MSGLLLGHFVLVLNHLIQISFGGVLHHDVNELVVVDDVEDFDDIRVTQLLQYLNFLEAAIEVFLVLDLLLGYLLDRHLLLQLDVSPQLHYCEGSLADLLFDYVVAQSLLVHLIK